MHRQKITPADIPSGDSVIYEYGIRIDKDSAALVGAQISQARRLYNDVVASIRNTITDLQAFVVDRSGPEAISVQAEIEALTKAFAAAKAADSEPDMQRIAESRREKWRTLSGTLKAARKEHRAEIQERFLSRIGRNATCDTYKLRSAAVAAGLGWGTANAVLDAGLQAFKKSFALGKAPRFAAGAEIDQDCLTLQFTAAGGIPAENILTDKHAEFMLRPDGGCGPRKYGELRFRLGSAKADTWVSGTWQYHRPLPEGSHISLARLVRRRVGPHLKWAVQLLVKPITPIREEVGERAPLVTVHFGWSADVEGRRVAGLADSADPGAAKIVALPPSIEAALERAAEIQGKRDESRDAVAVKVRAIELPESAGEVLQEVVGKMRRTRPQDISANRLHYVCRLLRDEDRLPEWLEEWRHADRLLWQDQTHIAKRARNARKTFYRELAISLGRRYSAIAIEPLDLASAAVKVSELTGEKSEFSKKARAGRVVAALYELESAIRWAATKTGAAVLDLVSETASQCSICGGSHVTASKEDHQTLLCSDCGAVLDRKQNGAALAWQAVSEKRDDHVEDFWIAHLGKRDDAASKKAEKLSKMAEGRRKTRTGSDGETPEGSRTEESAG